MLQVGPYVFTLTDARRTVANLGALWSMYTHGIDPVPTGARARADEVARLLAAAAGADLDEREGTEASLRAAGAIADHHLAAGTWSDGDAGAALAGAWAGLRAVGDELRAAGLLPTSGTGVVDQLSRSDGGVPKSAVDAVDVDWSGVVGDAQAARQHHGRPWQALCLWSGEVIDRFVEQGHPLAPGAAGENVTIRGLDWEGIRPGVVMQLGTARCEVSSFALPCSKNARWFVDGAFTLMHHDAGPVSRVYATVLQPGVIRTGDAVTLAP